MRTFSVGRLLGAACLLTGLSFQDAESSTLNDTRVRVPMAVTSPAHPAAANRRQSQSDVAIGALVNGKQLHVKGDGQCKHEPNGFIYGSPALLWTVESSDRNNALQRLTLAQGSAYATTTLLSYTISGVGIVSALSTLGVSWDKLQWLVAALSVGIVALKR